MNQLKLYFLLGCTAATAAASAQGKFDAGGNLIMSQYRQSQQSSAVIAPLAMPLPFDLQQASRGVAAASVYVTLANGHTALDLEALGFEVQVDGGDVVQVAGPMSVIADLEHCDFVKGISFGELRTVKLDRARRATHVEDIHQGTGLSSSYKGAGVITGIYDMGFDPNHANFRNSDGTSRLGRLWHFNGSGGGFLTYIGDERIQSFKTDNASESHGTHTTGCMAGSFNRRGGGTVALYDETGTFQCGLRYANPYYGMAPESTIAAGCGALYDANITGAVSNIVEYAKSEGKPCVINLSLGSNLGRHDAEDPTVKILDKLGEDAIICMSAGNEGDLPVSVVYNCTDAAPSFTTVFAGKSGGSGVIDIYGSNDTPLEITLSVYDKENAKMLYSLPLQPGRTSDVVITTKEYSNPAYIHNDIFDRAFTQSNIQAGAPSTLGNRYGVRMSVSLSNNKTYNSNGNYVLAISVKSSAGSTIHLTTNSDNAEFTDAGVQGFLDGTSAFTINSMACGRNTLCVGAWNTRFTIPVVYTGTGAQYNYTGDGFAEDSIAGYSSWGVLADGRSLPHVCAPGTGIISSISMYQYDNSVKYDSQYAWGISANQTFNGRSNHWENMQGTSMATPIVAGGIALWLQYDPTLTVDRVRTIIAETSDRDSFVTGDPNQVRWGAGKFNALAGLLKLMGGGVNDVAVGADNGFVAVPDGQDKWQVTLPGANGLTVNIYNTCGQLVSSFAGEGTTATVSTAGLAAGVYVLTADGRHSTRIVVR